MHTTTRTMTALAALATAVLAGCSSNSRDAVDAAPPTTPAETITPATETPTPTEEPEDEAFTLTETVTYEDDVAVSLSAFTRGTSSDYASPENTPYIKFKVQIRNGSQGTMDLNEMYISCLYGDDGRTGEQIFDDGLDMPTTHLRPGRTANATTACQLPKDESYVQIEVTPSAETETAIFAGEVKK